MGRIPRLLAAAALALSAVKGGATPIPSAPPAPEGTLAGSRIYTFFGFVKVDAVVTGGRLVNVRVREYPDHSGTSRRINEFALPYLVREAVDSQSPNIDAVSGATITSEAFAQSLYSALSKSQNGPLSSGG
jgi:uncharacterized protein with FMN-binding domain